MAAKTDDETLTIPSLTTWPKLSNGSGHNGPYIVICYNDDVHTFDEVIHQLIKATGCSFSKAEGLAFEIDREGRAVVYAGSEEECERVANVLREIKLQVETDRGA